MSVLASLKENKPLAVVVGVSLVLTIVLIVTLIVLDNKAQKQVDELTEQATGTRAALDLAIQELEACGKLDEFVENVKDIPGAPELLETSGALYGSSARNRGRNRGRNWGRNRGRKKPKRPWWQNRIKNTDERTKEIIDKVNGLEKLIKSMGDAGADTPTLDAEIKELKAKIAKLEKINAELEKAKERAERGRGKAIIEKEEADKKVNELQSAQRTIELLEGSNTKLGKMHEDQKRKNAELESRITELTVERDGLLNALSTQHDEAVKVIDKTNVVLSAVFAEAMKLIPAGDRKAYLETVGSLAKKNRVIIKSLAQQTTNALDFDRVQRDVGFILNAIAAHPSDNQRRFPGMDDDLVTAFDVFVFRPMHVYWMDQTVQKYGSETLKSKWKLLSEKETMETPQHPSPEQTVLDEEMDRPHNTLGWHFWANNAEKRLAEVVRQHKEFPYPPKFQIGFPAVMSNEWKKSIFSNPNDRKLEDERCEKVQNAFKAADLTVKCGPVNPTNEALNIQLN